MGMCNCKDRTQAVKINAEVSVPIDDNKYPDEQNEEFLKEFGENRGSPKMIAKKKQFLKLKTVKNEDSNKIQEKNKDQVNPKVEVSSEKLFIKGKTLKGMNRAAMWGRKSTNLMMDNADTAFTTNKSNEKEKGQISRHYTISNSYEKKQSKRGDLLKKYSINEEKYNIKVYKESDNQINPNNIVTSGTFKNSTTPMSSNKLNVTNISNQNVQYSLSHKEMDNEEEEKLFYILQNHFLFQEFNKALLKVIIDDLDGFQIEGGVYVYREGEEGNCFFIIKSGKMEVLSGETRVKVLSEGDCFGELALIQRCVRNSTMRSLTDCEFYVMEGKTYRDLTQNITRMRVGDVLFHLDLVPWLQCLDINSKNALARLTVVYGYEINQPVVLSNNREEDRIFILKQGLLSYIYNNKEVKKCYPREYFYEKWVFFDKQEVVNSIDPMRRYDIYSIDQTSICYIISRTALEEALGIDYREVILFSFFKSSLMKSQFFTNFFIESQYEGLFHIFELVYYYKGELVFGMDKNNENGNVKFNSLKNDNNNEKKKIVFILEGNLVDSVKYEIKAKKGEIYGEEIMDSKRDYQGAEIIANPECLVLEATWENIRNLLKNSSLTNSMDIFRRINNLKKISIFNHSSESKLLQICQLMEEEDYKPGEYIFMENTKGDKFYMLKKGRVKVIVKNKVVRELEDGNCFGELALLNEERRTASIAAIGNVQCYTLTKDKFLDLIDDNMMEYLKNKLCLQDPELKLSDLYYLSFIGKGRFGSVYLVHNTTFLYAVKVISKKAVEKQKSLHKYLLSEKRLMLGLDHPFIVKLVKTLKNENFCYFLLEFINGVNMEEYLSNRKTKKNLFETKFYTASLLVIVDYLNSKSIAHRDIKPLNIMIDRNGYLKLIDFGTAKKIVDFTHTVIGTPHYTAPEVLTGKGYSFSCDYWSVGVTMYYIFYGSLPYGNNANDIMEIYKEILNKEVTFPDGPNSYDVNSLLQILLSRRISTRMCNLNSFKSQFIFKDLNWDDLKDFRVKPPYIPVNIREWSSNLRNLSNPFDSYSGIQVDKFVDNNNYEDQTPCEYNNNWFEEF